MADEYAAQTEEEVHVLKPDDSPDGMDDEPKIKKPAAPKFQPALIQKAIKERLVKVETIAKKPPVWITAIIVLIVAIFAVLFALFGGKTEPIYQKAPLTVVGAVEAARNESDLINDSLRVSNLERMIAKAAMLYAEGNTVQALDIYEQVSIFSEVLSQYNLGVARMQKGEYEAALEAFDAQLATDPHKTAGAINAAVCALKLGHEELMRRYIKIARDHIHLEMTAPLYPFYYTLINYYDNKPFGTLAAAEVMTIDYQNESRNLISSKMHLIFEDTKGAIAALEKVEDPKNLLALGLMYAKIGDYDRATNYLLNAISSNIDPAKARAALVLVYLKSGFFKEAANVINLMERDNQDPLIYPIRIKLKDRLFDIALTQEYFTENSLINEEVFLQVFFTHVPYVMIDPDRSIAEITKAQSIMSQIELDEAITLLQSGGAMANTGAKMSLAIKLAHNNRLLQANEALAAAQRLFKNSDTLEYNLALSFAQLSEFDQAFTHFRRAYMLNRGNAQAGIYALMLAPSANVKDQRLLEELMQRYGEGRTEKDRFYTALLSFYDRNYQSTAQWLERKEGENDETLHTILDLFAAERLGQNDELMIASKKLVDRYPKDLLFEMIELYATNKRNTIKSFAFNAQEFMLRRDIDLTSLNYGAPIVRDLYIRLAAVTGNLEMTRQRLIEQLAIEQGEVRTMMQSLMKINILRQNFEEAYTIGNALIDEYGMRDNETLISVAIASIGAGHKENAIALLQIAKNNNTQNREARYALGLLYQEIGNARGAALEYSMIGAERYESRYFDFEIRPDGDPEQPIFAQ
ncbi:membrane protein [Campylobacterota bacterium]|nr:membrane protein [Campylobacterota bacterium]